MGRVLVFSIGVKGVEGEGGFEGQRRGGGSGAM